MHCVCNIIFMQNAGKYYLAVRILKGSDTRIVNHSGTLRLTSKQY